MPPAELRDLRRHIIEASAKAGEGHVPSAFSILDILWVLYDRLMNIDPANPTAETRDRFILSKGHASLGLYAVLAHKGVFGAEAFVTFGKYGGILGSHPDSTIVPGVEASTGSLGHGFPIAVGVAMGQRIRKMSARTFCLIGDGEANEGSVWEAALLGAHHKLENITCIVAHTIKGKGCPPNWPSFWGAHMSMRRQLVQTISALLASDERVVVLFGDIGVFGFRDAIVHAFRHQGRAATSARLALAYGPGTRTDDQRVLNSLMRRVLLERHITLMDQGAARRTYGYITDAVEMLLSIMLTGKDAVYNVGGRSQVTILELASLIGRIIGLPVKVPTEANELAGAPSDVSLDLTCYGAEFKKTNFVSFEDGIARNIAWQHELYGVPV